MSKLDSTELRDAAPGTPGQRPKSAAASRILRAVEKSRSSDSSVKPDSPVEPEVPPVSAASPSVATPAPVTPAAAAVSEVEAEEQKQPAIPEAAAAEAAQKSNPPAQAVPEEKPAGKIAENLKASPSEPLAETAPTESPAVETVLKVLAERQAESGSKAAVPSPAAPKSKPGKKASDKDKKESAKPQVQAKVEAKAQESPQADLPISFGPKTKDSVSSRVPVIGFALLILVGGGAAYLKFGGAASTASPSAKASGSPVAGVFVPMGGVGGWSPNWAADGGGAGGRSISCFRPSAQHANYRVEFEGQIEQKGFGWVVRAKDAKNFYAFKLEVVKPGLQPLVALSRVSMVEGVESQKKYTLLDKPVRPDTVFKVRMDVNRTDFRTWVNDALIEVWNDSQIATGGVGLFTEKGELAQIRKVQIFEMR